VEGDCMKYLNQWDTNYRQILRCIGGVADGQWKSVPESMKVGDIFRVQEEFKLSTSDLLHFPKSEDEAVLGHTINYHEYRICVLHFNKDEAYKFLVANKMSDKEAILQQFHK